MAVLSVSFYSEALWRQVPVEVILPIDKWEDGVNTQLGKKFKTLYLLHGLHGDHMDWVTKSGIRRYAEDNDLAVVMPAGDNSFYVDREAMRANYGDFIGRELVEITRAMFPLFHKWEATYIGGLSMGGYGAMRNGLKYNRTFSRIIALSAALQNFEPGEVTFRKYRESLFGDLDKAKDSDLNPRWLLEHLEGPVPKVFLACGTEDGLLSHSRLYKGPLAEAKVPTHYEEWEGGHTWDFWDEGIRKAIHWIFHE